MEDLHGMTFCSVRLYHSHWLVVMFHMVQDVKCQCMNISVQGEARFHGGGAHGIHKLMRKKAFISTATCEMDQWYTHEVTY